MDETNVTSVEIFGREYKIKGFADEKYIVKVAKYVDGKMKELSKNSSLSSGDRLAILAALNIADELFRGKEEASETFSLIEQKSDELIQKLDGTFQAES
jgi:cell division protein ZapA